MTLRLALAIALPALVFAEKRQSVFTDAAARQRAIANAGRYPWAAEIRGKTVAEAERWVHRSDADLWDDIFGPHVTRSHMVWSSGFCPKCRRKTPMYDWRIDAWASPWKVQCPHCNERFPTNDFAAYHRSGLDEHGVFQPQKADRSLLYNQAHPDPRDPLHRFGVDDGEGYVEGANRWRFIGAYLLYGQWRQRIEAGVRNLSLAYSMTGDARYAHNAGVLLDRIADVWPTFDFASQGLVYERRRYGGGVAGYVFYAIDSAGNVTELARAYDRVFDAIRNDEALVRFLRGKNPAKRTFADVQRNIETNIFRHTLAHPHMIRTNYPGQERAEAVMTSVLDWPANRDGLRAVMDRLVEKAVAVDGLSGEKGLAGYASIAPRALAGILEEFSALDPGLVPYLVARHPALRQTYRFHFDTWIDHAYYPHSGDSGSFARKSERYVGIDFQDGVYTLLGRLAEATRDPLYWQMAWIGNGHKTSGLPHDIFAADPGAFAASVQAAVDRHGAWPRVSSVNKEQWRIAVMRHRTAPDAAVWMDYDSVPESPIKSHYHFDAMNVGLFAKGLDLLPELGYPAVQYGDWHTPQALWTKRTAAHNTVVVDGADQKGGAAQSVLWKGDGPVQAIRARSPGQYGGSVYERTLLMVETSPADFYVFDVFDVAGGKEHAKHTHSSFAAAVPFGLRPTTADSPYGAGTLMRGFQCDTAAATGWGVDWKIEDRYRYRAPGSPEVRVRYTDLSRDATACVAEMWVVDGYSADSEHWIPAVVTRRRSDAEGLASTFVAVMEPFEAASRIRRIRRLDQSGQDRVEIEVELADGSRDRLTSRAAGVAWERRDAAGRLVFQGEAAAAGREQASGGTRRFGIR